MVRHAYYLLVPFPDPEQVDELRLAVIRLDRKLRKSGRSGGVTPSQLSALFALDRHGPLRLGELARREQISKSTVTRMVAGLEARHLISRAPDDHDARSSIVDVTPAGRGLLAELARESNDYLRLRIASLGEAEQARLVAALPILTRLADRA
jgi:DNA-binding MarR family transcriptional regulator